MLAPISWLKEYVDIKMPTKELAWRLTELGLGVESIKNVDGEEVLELEITPNRPDLLSIVGIAREIAAITGQKLNIVPEKNDIKKQIKPFPVEIKPNYDVVPRIISVIIKGVTVKPSPDWIQKRLLQVGLRPINNLVDITNYVLWTYGSLLHVFDYDKIRNHQMNVELSKGGEEFRSLDGIDYKLPKGAIVIKDVDRVIDLLPLKGGDNTAASDQTKNVLLHSIVCGAVITRKTSHLLNLRSDSSVIAERGLDPNGPLYSINKALKLILELAGGEVVSELIDHKAKEYKPWNLTLRLSRLQRVTGIQISINTVLKILDSLNLSPNLKVDVVSCTIPTYRGDLKIEEDLIEEVARVYGYNNYPLTIPSGTIPTTQVAYYKDYSFEEKIKQLLVASGFTEIYTYSLIGQDKHDKLGSPSQRIKITNPVNSDYEYLRPGLAGNMLEAIKLNLANFKEVNLFEMGRIYQGTPPNTQEPTQLVMAQNNKELFSLKGTVENLFARLGYPSLGVKPLKEVEPKTYPAFLEINTSALLVLGKEKVGYIGQVKNTVANKFGILDKVWICAIDIEMLRKNSVNIKYQPIPLYPELVQDLALIIKSKTYVGPLMDTIKNVDGLIRDVTLLDTHENTRTIRITYQSPTKTLSEKEIKPLREKILKLVLEKFGAKLKSK